MTALYNEIDKHAAAVLNAEIEDGVIAPGIVNTTSIKELHGNDLRGFTQVHLFAGGGLWSVAARLAGWPDDNPLWTASCPCQPFSQAGQGGGTDDPRHLWPDVDRLVREANAGGHGPGVIVGEQVAGKAGYDWFDGVRTDLARQGYGAWVVDIPSCAVDAPNIRQRLYWIAVADAQRERQQGVLQRSGSVQPTGGSRPADQSERRDESDGYMANTSPRRADGHGQVREQDGQASCGRRGLHSDGGDGERTVDNAISDRQREQGEQIRTRRHSTDLSNAKPNGSYWSDHEWSICHDGKARRTKPGLRLLVDGLPGRVGLWRVAGNAINPVLAAEVLKAYLDVEVFA